MKYKAEVERLLASPDIGINLYQQYLLCANLKLLWPSMTGQQRQDALRTLSRILPRCAAAEDPEGLTERILQLPDDDLYAALRFSFAQSEYVLQPGEEIYPTTGWLGTYLRYARAGNAPLAFHFWSAILILGACCQRRVFFPGGKHVFMNMYIVLGSPRSGGKGQGYEPAIDLLNLVNRKLTPDFGDEVRNLDKLVCVLPPDSTQEAVVTKLASRRRPVAEREDGTTNINLNPEANRIDATGVLGLDEMATWFGKDAWAVAKKAPWLVTIKETNRYEKETKSGGHEVLNNTAISMLACCAPDWMQSTIEADLFGGGFMDRCIWVYREPVFPRRREQSIVSAMPKDPLMAEMLAEWIIEKVLSQDIKVPVLFTKEAEERHAEFHRMLVDEEEIEYRTFGADSEKTSANRLDWSTVQVASLLALSEGEFPPVTVELRHLNSAIELVMAEENSMAEFMGEANRRKDVKTEVQILKYIELNGGCARLGEITSQFTREMGSKAVKEYLNALMDQEKLTTDLLPSMGGRRAQVYRLKGHTCEKCAVK